MFKGKEILFCGLFFLFSYQHLPYDENFKLVVNLKQEINDEICFDEDLVEYDFRPLNKLASYNKFVGENYKGIPVCDSLYFYNYVVDYPQFSFDLYKSGKYEKDSFIKFIQKFDIDTLKLSKIPLKQNLVTVIGFKKDKQIIIADANNDMNFDDEIKYEFDINFRKNPLENLKLLNNLPLAKFSCQFLSNGAIQTYDRNFIIYPNSNHVFVQRLNKREKNYLSFLKFRDYWKGTILVKKKAFEFYVQASTNEYAVIYVKQKETPFSSTDKVYNRQFMHKINDTIKLSDKYFKLDSIDKSISKLYLTEIKKNNIKSGYYVGQFMNNFEFKKLDGQLFNLMDVAKERKYTLIEFWGTWCGPCKKITPFLKETFKANTSKLNIIGIAVDKNEDLVKKYIIENGMTWTNIFLDIKNINKGILEELKIQAYPTFILIDNEGKILYRGSTDSFDEMVQLIK